ncbi:MAG: hypothetical protein M5R36_15600 [Deltaproteobacteria bacterium]|nr:hypothetical protein [Deltaproteobacteria bacterium]
MANLLSKKFLTTGGALGGICYVASLVATGGLSLAAGLTFAGLLAGLSAFHVHTQGKIDGQRMGSSERTAP